MAGQTTGSWAHEQDHTRAADADRERTADILRKHHADGRLSDDEFQERLERCMAATTLGELRTLVGDLPAEQPSRERAAGWRPRRFALLAAALLVGVVLLATSGHGWAEPGVHHHWFPWPLVVIGLVLFARRGRGCAWRDMPLPPPR